MLFARLVLVVQLLVMAGLGLAYWFQPYEMANFNGMLLMETDSVSHIRVYFGGLQFGLAIFLGWSMRARESIRAGLMLVVITQAALVLARLASTLVDDSPLLSLDLGAMLYKVVIGALAAFAFYWLSRPDPATLVRRDPLDDGYAGEPTLRRAGQESAQAQNE